MHKGQAGRIAVIGGCEEYTGAPYYASVSALKGGCDLSYVICTKSASTPIKSYTPEIIVFPYVYEEDQSGKSGLNTDQEVNRCVKSIEDLFPRLHALVLGPGMGRSKPALDIAAKVIQSAKDKHLPLIIDGDCLYLVSQKLDLIKGYPNAVLLPNKVEYQRLYEATFSKEDNSSDDQLKLEKLCNELGNVTIVKKGSVDLISNGKRTIICEEEGSPRRSGGQGDILAGLTATFVHWAHWAPERLKGDKQFNEKVEDLVLYSAYSSCLVTRVAGRTAFSKHHRSTTAPDILEALPYAIQSVFPVEQQ